MPRTKTRLTVETLLVEPAPLDNTNMVKTDFHIPSPAEISTLSPDELALAEELAMKAITSMVLELKRSFVNGNGGDIYGALNLYPPDTTNRVKSQTLTRIKDIMLKSGWYVEITRRSMDPCYNYRIKDHKVILEQEALLKAQARKKVRLWSYGICLVVTVLLCIGVALGFSHEKTRQNNSAIIHANPPPVLMQHANLPVPPSR